MSPSKEEPTYAFLSMKRRTVQGEDHSTSIGPLGKFLLYLSPNDEVKAFDNLKILRGTVGRPLESRGMLFERCPRWRRVELDFLPFMLKNAYVGSSLDGGIYIKDLRSS